MTNNQHGIRCNESSDNTITDNIVSDNRSGILLKTSNNNRVFNNKFYDNYNQAEVVNSTGNEFHLDLPTGGNYWNDWTGPDADGDGIVDSPYVFEGGQDDLPWAQPDGWILARIESLIDYIALLDLPEGLTNSLGALLDVAQEMLSDDYPDNDVAAVGQLEAFINQVEAQRDKKIPAEDADFLVNAAREIIAMLNS